MSAPLRPQSMLAPVPARRPLLDGRAAANEALRVVIGEALAQIGANAPVVVQTQSSEGLHQLRVGLRRLRTALTLIPSRPLAELDMRAKQIIASVGPARDADVFLHHLFLPAVNALGPRRGFDILAARCEAWRGRAWQTAVAGISAAAFRRFEDDTAAAARAVAWARDKTIREVAPPLLDHALKRAKKRGRHFADLDPPSRHRLRIALKKLRYTGEFLAPLYPHKAVKRWLEPLKELQDLLGDLNDVAQVRCVVGRLLLEEAENAGVQADLSHAAGLLQGFHQGRADTIAGKTTARWKVFRGSDPFWR